jgi:hypothetical protein
VLVKASGDVKNELIAEYEVCEVLVKASGDY